MAAVSRFRFLFTFTSSADEGVNMKIFELSKNPPECRVDGSIFALASPTPTLFDQVADQLAKELSNPEFLVNKWNNRTRTYEWTIERSKDANKSTQIRKFYDELTMWVAKSKDEETLSRNLPFIRMMNAKVAYANGRKHVDDKFRVPDRGSVNPSPLGEG